MSYTKPQILASYSLDASVSDVRAACSSNGVPSGDIFADFGNNCGYISSPTINGNVFSGNWHSLL